MKYLITTIAALVLVGCGETQQSTSTNEAKPAEPVAEVPAQQSATPAKAKPTKSVAENKQVNPKANKALLNAAKKDDIEAAKQAVTDGADVNVKDYQGRTALNVAVFYHYKDIAKLLIGKGADVNANGDGGTPLHLAAMFGHKEIAKLLIEKGADVNVKSKIEDTPLHYAKTKEIAELLIAKGADVNAKALLEQTPLHSAVLAGHKEIAELLIAKGADVNTKTKRGETPLDFVMPARDSETT